MLISANPFLNFQLLLRHDLLRERLADILSEMLALTREASVIAENVPHKTALDAEVLHSIDEIGNEITKLLDRLGS